MNPHFLSTKLVHHIFGNKRKVFETNLKKVIFWVTSRRIASELYWHRTHVRSVRLFIFSCIVGMFSQVHAQLGTPKEKFTHADTLRGSNNENRNWWDVLRYDVEVWPFFEKKEIWGIVKIVYKISPSANNQIYPNNRDSILMQVDLQQPLLVDRIFSIDAALTKSLYSKKDKKRVIVRLPWERKGDIIEITFPGDYINEKANKKDSFFIYYHGNPLEAKTPPWDGGWIWKNDKNNNPWMSVAVQGLGASAWYPCKDYQGDEPDNGASLTMNVPETMVAVANGRLEKESNIRNQQLTSYKWQVKNPINNYNIVPYIGKYVNFTDTLMGENGKLDLSYWVLDYNLEKAKEHFKQVKPMLRSMEYWFGPYPFYEDSYKLVDAPHLGMEHQSAVAYGNQYKNGYLGSDRSGKTGWGLKWDFIIVHESGHEWFGNSITTNDIADMWVHEAFTTYSETLFTEFYYGIQAGNEYNFGQRKNIHNDIPIIGPYGVNKEGSGDEYDKGSNMIHSIRHAMNDDKKFREILRGLNKTFYHKTVTTKQIEDFINQQAGFNFQKVFDQYLRTTQVPTLEYYFKKEGELFYRYSNCIKGFNLPLVLNNDNLQVKLFATDDWKSIQLKKEEQAFVLPENLEKLFYIKVQKVNL